MAAARVSDYGVEQVPGRKADHAPRTNSDAPRTGSDAPRTGSDAPSTSSHRPDPTTPFPARSPRGADASRTPRPMRHSTAPDRRGRGALILLTRRPTSAAAVACGRVPAVVFLVRHGESEWNAARRVQGQTADVPLTELGIRQAREAAGQLGPIDAIWTSDLLRARQTADIIGARRGLRPRLCPELREQGLGALEGRGFDEAMSLAASFDWTDPDTRIPGGESLRDVYQRLESVLRPLREEDGLRLAIVSHGDTIRVAMAVLAGRAVEQVQTGRITNGSVTTLHLGATLAQPAACSASASARRILPLVSAASSASDQSRSRSSASSAG